jgi:hypothetical protein
VNPQPVPAPKGVCVFCEEIHPLLVGGMTAKHSYPDGSDCPGSARRPAQHDGKDDVRRHAIQQLNSINSSIATRRAEMRADLDKGWKVGGLFEYHGAVLVRLESLAARWGELTVHGDWWLVLQSAMQECIRDISSTALIDQAVAYERARGNRLWLAEARPALVKESAKLDPVGRDVIDNLLYRM